MASGSIDEAATTPAAPNWGTSGQVWHSGGASSAQAGRLIRTAVPHFWQGASSMYGSGR